MIETCEEKLNTTLQTSYNQEPVAGVSTKNRIIYKAPIKR